MRAQNYSKIAQKLGHDVSNEGICFGVSALLAQALLLKKENEFFDRLRLIDSYKGDIELLIKEIDEAKQKLKIKKTLSQKELKLLEIPAFFDGIALALFPYKYPELFNGQFISQLDVESVFPIISSRELEKTPVSVILNKNYSFNDEELSHYLSDLEQVLKEIDDTIPIFLSSINHSILIHYDKTKQKWMYSDINKFDRALHFGYDYQVEFDTKQLAKGIFGSFAHNDPKIKSPHVVFNTMAISNNPSINNTFFESVHSKYPFQQAHALRYDAYGAGLLQMAALTGDVDQVKSILASPNSNVNIQTEGFTALMMACQNNHLEVVKILLQHKTINVNLLTKAKESALHISSRLGHVDVVKELLKISDIHLNTPDSDCNTPLHIACSKGDTLVIRALLSRSDSAVVNKTSILRLTPLHMACIYGEVNAVRELLAQPDIDIYKKSMLGMMPLDLVPDDPKNIKAFIKLYFSIKEMELQGRYLLSLDKTKGETALHLVKKLNQKVGDFFGDCKVKKDIKAEEWETFTSEFKTLLHSQDDVMKHHRELWKPIVANILLALTGIGLVLIALNFIINSSSKNSRDAFFFGKTTSEKLIEQIDVSLDRTSHAMKH